MAGRQVDDSWHLDKRVSIATIFAVILQLIVLLVGGSIMVADLKGAIAANATSIETMDDLHSVRMGTNERRIVNVEGAMESQRQSIQRQDVMLGRIETKLGSLENILGRIESVLAAQERRLDVMNGMNGELRQ